MKLWKGIEREGMYEGVQTLFIGSKTITYNDINEALKKDRDIEQLYFGAGCCTEINENVLLQCSNKMLAITMEIDINDLHKYSKDILKNINVIITINHKNFPILNILDTMTTQIKLQSINTKEKILTMSSLNWFENTDIKTLKGKTYKGDKVIK